MSEKEMIEVLIEEFTTMHLPTMGGYPSPYVWVGVGGEIDEPSRPGDCLVIYCHSSPDEGYLEVHTYRDIQRWFRRAQKFAKDYDEEFSYALHETQRS